MPTRSKSESSAEDARFVFIGTLRKLRAATMSDIPIDPATAIVRVDEVIHAPEALAHYAGQDITVRLDTRKRLKAAEQATFYTNAWLFGESVAVQALDIQDVTASTSRAARGMGDPVRRLAQRDLQSRFAHAKLVVSGRVTSVRVPRDLAAARSARGSQTPLTRRISEHDPDWRIAEIQVDQVHKGRFQKDNVSVRFPRSEDVMWHDAPKFHPGQAGFFMLYKAEDGPEEAAAMARSMPPRDKGEFVVPRSIDFQPFSEPGGVRELIGPTASASATPSPEEKPEAPRRVRASRKRPAAAPRKRR
jgi:hypothetical protein